MAPSVEIRDEAPDAVPDATLEHVEKPDAVDAGVQPLMPVTS